MSSSNSSSSSNLKDLATEENVVATEENVVATEAVTEENVVAPEAVTEENVVAPEAKGYLEEATASIEEATTARINEQNEKFEATLHSTKAYNAKTNHRNNLLIGGLLFLSLVVVIASAAVLAALYAPEHMPTAISAIVNNLSPAMYQTIQGLAYGIGALGILGVAYQSAAINHNRKSTLSLSQSGLFANNTTETTKTTKTSVEPKVDVTPVTPGM